MTPARAELLQSMPIFGALRDDVLDFLIVRMRVRRVEAGAYAVREGDAAESLFIVEQGRATVLKGWEGHEVALGALGPGDCFGEMALMDLMPRSASVRADEACTLLELCAGDLDALWHHDAEQFTLLQMNLGREVSRRLRQSGERLFRLQMAYEPETAWDGGWATP